MSTLPAQHRQEKTDDQKNYEANLHAKYAPSAMKRIMECAISVPLSEGMPEGKRSKYSLNGSVGHFVSEVVVSERLENRTINRELRREIEQKVKKQFPKFDLKKDFEETIIHASGYADFIYEKVSPYLEFEHSWWLETRVSIDDGRDCWGTADFLFVFKRDEKLYAILIDYKYGEGIVVDSIDNWQLISYALGAMLSISSADYKIQKVEAHIYQPRVKFNAEPVLFRRKELVEDKLVQITKRIDLIEGWKKKYKTIEKYPQELFEKYQHVGDHCQFCRAKAICKPFKQQYKIQNTVDLLKSAIKNVGKKKNEYTDIKQALEKGIVAYDDLVFIALNASKIVNFVRACPSTAMSLIARGEKLNGVKVIETSEKRQWIEDEAKREELLKKRGIKYPYQMEKKWLSIGAVEELIGEDGLKGLVTKPGKNYKLVPEGHKEAAVKFGLDNQALFRSHLNKESERDNEDE